MITLSGWEGSTGAARRWAWKLLPGLALGLCGLVEFSAQAQVLGEHAEMDRLEARAEELIANGDAEGAAMSIGRAALMAGELAKRADDPRRGALLRGAESLFRAEEHAYRALALFERAGGRPPASAGVCGSLSLARQQLGEAASRLFTEDLPSQTTPPSDTPADSPAASQAHRLQTLAAEWKETIEDLGRDFHCP